MANTLITFDDGQIQKMEQLVLDQDGPGALRFLESLRRKMKLGQIGCNPIDLTARQGVERVVDKKSRQS
jgi:hypothetical protein